MGAGRERRSGASRAIFAVEFTTSVSISWTYCVRPGASTSRCAPSGGLPAALQHDIKGLLGATCEIAGLAGSWDLRGAELFSLPDALAPSARNFVG
jgi:hypothetical protein